MARLDWRGTSDDGQRPPMNSLPRSVPVAPSISRQRIQVRGLVQGVGFRPHVYRCALAHDLAGWVCNDGQGVSIEVEGRDVDGFVRSLEDQIPPLGRIDSLQRFELPVALESGFQIRKSNADGTTSAAIPADAAICDRCVRELFDRQDRRYLHPFIACSDCGPRYSMTRAVPYDRQNTTMAEHPMCDACAVDYGDPLGRRLHAEPIACHDCGPVLSHTLEAIGAAIRVGKIVALKGVGGFHLVGDARNADLVLRLRTRKQRSDKPFAVMLLNRASACTELELSDPALTELQSWRRPVVVGERQMHGALHRELAPGLSTQGVMLPYTGIHYLLFWELAGRPDGHSWLSQVSDIALLMTSANISGDPILADNEETHAALADVADLVVTHDREICCESDDSVLRDAQGTLVQLRRSRGYVPQSLNLGRTLPPVLGTGAYLKNTVCAVRGDQAFMSAHLGDMASVATRRFAQDSLAALLEQLAFTPQAIACDLHPDYASSRVAETLAVRYAIPLIAVQHHHAHAASVLALADYRESALALVLDGHGMGADGASWGGELLRLDGANMQRLGHLQPLATPGGDKAAREPWRMAVAALSMLGRDDDARARFGDLPMIDAVVSLARSPDCPRSSSAGRLFDAVAGLLDVCHTTGYEAEAPMRLESLVRAPQSLENGYHIADDSVLDFAELLRALSDIDEATRGAELFHGTLVDGLAAWVAQHANAQNLECVALSGGCFANRWLARMLPDRLERQGLRVLSEWDRLPPGDGGVSLGQAYIAALTLENN
jgi:hydrogenase maturation protein HypF